MRASSLSITMGEESSTSAQASTTQWEKVWETSLDGEFSATLSIATREGCTPSFSLLVRRQDNKGLTSIIPLNRNEAVWLIDNLKNKGACGYTTTTSTGTVARKIEIETLEAKQHTIFKIVSSRSGRKVLKRYVPSWRAEAFVAMLQEGVDRFVALS